MCYVLLLQRWPWRSQPPGIPLTLNRTPVTKPDRSSYLIFHLLMVKLGGHENFVSHRIDRKRRHK